MGISAIKLEGEDREAVEEVRGDPHVVDMLLPDVSDVSFQCLRFVDPYGETVFNRLQMTQFLPEWDRLRGRATTLDQKRLFQDVRRLAERCSNEPHLYLRFSGD